MKKIIHAFHIEAPADHVYKALVTENGLANWWSTKVSAEERVGSIIQFTFIGEFNPEMEITTLEKNRAVEWKCVGGHDNWLDNHFSFKLSAEAENGTKVLFTQTYAKELDDEIYGTYNFNWGYYLNSLKLYCETGAGTPFRAAE